MRHCPHISENFPDHPGYRTPDGVTAGKTVSLLLNLRAVQPGLVPPGQADRPPFFCGIIESTHTN